MTLIWLRRTMGSCRSVQELTDEMHCSSQRFGLEINVEKTKTMTIGKQQKTVKIKIEGGTLEQVTEFIYLGEVIRPNGTRNEHERSGGQQQEQKDLEKSC